ncbi:MAG: hypothetical protein AAFY15_05595, partial [Cyanobacteria bacterium J06648_11]
QWQLVQTQTGQTRITNALSALLKPLLGSQSEDELFRHTQHALTTLLEAPLVGIFNRTLMKANGRVRPGSLHASYQGADFALSADAKTELAFDSDPLVQECFQSAGVISHLVDRLNEPTLTWLDAPKLGCVLAIACMPLPPGPIDWASIIVVGAEADRQWQPYHLLALERVRLAFCSTLSRIYDARAYSLRIGELTQLNWFKHRYLTYFQAGIASGWRQLKKVMPPVEEREGATQWDRIAEVTQGLREMATQAGPLVKQEYWYVRPGNHRVSLTKLIRRTLLRLQPQIERGKLWSRVHGETNVVVRGDLGRLEMILSELIALAIHRSQSGGRLEVWSQPAAEVVEVSITDEGESIADLVTALGDRQIVPATLPALSPLSPKSILTQSPGRELYLCQYLIAQMGGGLSFFQARDGRNVSRLVLLVAQQTNVPE